MRIRLSFLRRAYIPPVALPAEKQPVSRRLIVGPEILPGDDGANINVPSLIRVPDWVEAPLGRYYLYFASHAGSRYIRLAFADTLEGPWRIRPEGSLHAANVPMIGDGLGAPDVHVDRERRQIRMYFHATSKRRDKTRAFVATSDNGLDFEVLGDLARTFYFRAFAHGGTWYGLSKGGRLYRSRDGLSKFARGPDAFPSIGGNGTHYNAPGSTRHVSIETFADHADIYYTRIGDAPEVVLKSRLELGGNWRKWRAGPPQEVMRGTENWEGANLPIEPSRSGKSMEPVNQLRDPEIFVDDDGSRYLAYAVAGERGIALARLD